jgi:tRNA threonylcarbamoyl adenosine modification protein (Sua5/YciO/YrdC/YwlC family)
MSQYFRLHPDNPQPRLVKQAVQIINDGGVVALPTDSSYALACHLDDKNAVERLRRIRGLDEKQLLSLLVRDLSELANFAMVDNRQYRLIKSVTPGPYVFVLQATKEVPRRLSHPSRKTIGLRVPEHAITLAILEELGQPLLGSTLIMPGETQPLNDPEDIRAAGKTTGSGNRRRPVRVRTVHGDRSERRRTGAGASRARFSRAIRSRRNGMNESGQTHATALLQ